MILDYKKGIQRPADGEKSGSSAAAVKTSGARQDQQDTFPHHLSPRQGKTIPDSVSGVQSGTRKLHMKFYLRRPEDAEEKQAVAGAGDI